MALKVVQRPPNARNRHTGRRRILAQELKPVVKTAERSRDKIVANWNNKPKFKATLKITPDAIEIVTEVRRGARLKGSSGNATTGDLWRWIDKTGTRPHVIRAKRQKSLAFPWGGPGSYKSKTGANPARYGGPGTVSGGKPTYRKQVNHPGFPPRKFSEVIDKDVEKDFRDAIRRARRKAQQAGY